MEIGDRKAAVVSASHLATYLFCARKLYLEERLDAGSALPVSPVSAPSRHAVREGLAENVVNSGEKTGVQAPESLRSPSLRLAGRVDEVKLDGDTVLAVQHKQGRAPTDGVWPGHRIQMGAYLLLLEELYREVPLRGVIRYKGGKIAEERQVVMNPYLRYEVLDIRDKVVHLLGSTELPDFTKDERKCDSCPLLEVCYDKEKVAALVQRADGGEDR